MQQGTNSFAVHKLGRNLFIFVLKKQNWEQESCGIIGETDSSYINLTSKLGKTLAVSLSAGNEIFYGFHS